jgi:hypothetical protein
MPLSLTFVYNQLMRHGYPQTSLGEAAFQFFTKVIQILEDLMDANA